MSTPFTRSSFSARRRPSMIDMAEWPRRGKPASGAYGAGALDGEAHRRLDGPYSAVVRKLHRHRSGAASVDDAAEQMRAAVEPQLARLAAIGLDLDHVEGAALGLPDAQVSAPRIE